MPKTMFTLAAVDFNTPSVNKYGRNFDIDTADVPEDIWSVGGPYPFPVAAAPTTIVSTDPNDTTGGTGLRSCAIFGVDNDGYEVIEVKPLDGITPVALDTDLWRVNRAFGMAVGSAEENIGDIQIKHGATIIGQIDAAMGQTHMTIYTVPKDYRGAKIRHIHVHVANKLTGWIDWGLQVRFSQASCWRTFLQRNKEDYDRDIAPGTEPVFPPGADIRGRVFAVQNNDSSITMEFDVILLEDGED